MTKYFIWSTILLSGILLLSSCDMSRWYFRHGGYQRTTKNKAVTDKQRASTSTSFTSGDESDFYDTLIAETYTEQNNTDVEIVIPTSPSDSIQREEVTKTISVGHVIQKDQETPSGKRFQRPSAIEIAIVVFLLFLMILVILVGLVLLISWIFVPFAVALRIALWVGVAVVVVGGILLLLDSIYNF